MIGQYRGKRLFAGRLFAGRLFGPPESVFFVWPQPQPVKKKRKDTDDDVLLFLLRRGPF